ncbi:H/ACA ribonucleoprotein complex non-core subunit NAF1 [Tanacetum coccineum]
MMLANVMVELNDDGGEISYVWQRDLVVLKERDLPLVPSVTVTIQPHHQTLPVGVVLSIMGAQVIVEGVDNHNPLSDDSILWITECRSPRVVGEIFRPLKNPYYIVRFNSESEVTAGIEQGSLISFVPEFANYVLNNNNLYKKGYDTSGENDEELSKELEFSDDEKKAEYKKMIKKVKKGIK